VGIFNHSASSPPNLEKEVRVGRRLKCQLFLLPLLAFQIGRKVKSEMFWLISK
jgi:hypothetical protein